MKNVLFFCLIFGSYNSFSQDIKLRIACEEEGVSLPLDRHFTLYLLTEYLEGIVVSKPELHSDTLYLLSYNPNLPMGFIGFCKKNIYSIGTSKWNFSDGTTLVFGVDKRPFDMDNISLSSRKYVHKTRFIVSLRTEPPHGDGFVQTQFVTDRKAYRRAAYDLIKLFQ